MKSKKRIRIAAIMVILLSGISFWMITHNNSGTIRKELFDFAVEDTASVTKIYMVSTSGKQVTLEKKSAGNWQVNGKFKSRNEGIRNLLVCIKELAVKQPVAKSAIESISKQMATNSTKVEIYSGEKLLKAYYVGADTQDGLGTFMLLTDPETGENSTLPFVMYIPGFNGFLSVRYFTEEDLWRERVIFNFYPDQISSISVNYTRMPDSSFTISLSDKNDISVSDSKEKNIGAFDTLKAKRYITYYTNIQYEALRNNMRKTFIDSVLAKEPVHVINLIDKAGKAHIVKTFPKPPDTPDEVDEVTGKPKTEDLEKMYALVNDGKDIALIQYFVFGKLFVSPSYFKTTPVSSLTTAVKK